LGVFFAFRQKTGQVSRQNWRANPPMADALQNLFNRSTDTKSVGLAFFWGRLYHKAMFGWPKQQFRKNRNRHD